jgi:hypothetical protein
MHAGGLPRIDDGPSNDEAQQESNQEDTGKNAAKTIPLRLPEHLHGIVSKAIAVAITA